MGVPAAAPGLASTRLAFQGESVVGGGVRRLAFREELTHVPVFLGEHAVYFAPDGTLLATLIGEVADPGAPGPFVIAPEEAAGRAARAVGIAAGRATVDGEPDEAGWLDVALVDVALEGTRARVAPVLVADGPTSAWRVEIAPESRPDQRWCVLVDATAGHVLRVIDLVRHAAARGRVVPGGYLAGSAMADFVDADVNVDGASPLGWVAVDATEGNNVDVQEDRAGDGNTTQGPRATGTGDPLTFDFAVTGTPLDDLDAALTNAFWATNLAHDRFHALGLDERSGACQNANFGRGGLGNDRTRVYVQYAAGVDATRVRNSNTAGLSADGGGNNLTFGLWDRSGTLRDGALDTGLVFHEYTHLVVGRLVGNDPACDDGTQPSALSEGWGDYFAASWSGDTVIGAWVTGEMVNGLRTSPIDRNGYTYANFCYVLGDYCDRNQNGEIWAGALWDLREALVAAHGALRGAERADRLVLEGMRYTPCQPTYPQARDGLLAADLALTGGVDRCLIWAAMAGRGLGVAAAATGPADATPLPGFDLPPDCSGSASVAWEEDTYGDDADARLLLADPSAGAATPRTLRVTASSGDSEDVALAGAAGVRSATLRIVAAAPTAGDGVMQVAAGDTLTARCTACPGSPQDTALVTRALRLRVLAHRVQSGSCDTDTITDFFYPEVSGLLDAGEWATLTVTLGNAEPFALEDVRVTATSDNPELTLVPVAPIPMGTVAAGGGGLPRAMPVVLRALVGTGAAFGDTATVTLDVEARGRSGSASLTIPLAADYQLERAVPAWGAAETFEAGSGSVGQWTHAPAAGLPADAWDLRNCGDGGGRAMTYSGSMGCGDYADTPSAATLVSPPVVDTGGGVVAAHPTGLSWRNEVDLGVDDTTGYCDSEMVLLYLTDNPARPDYFDPIGDRGNALQYWVQWPAFANTRNTAGWANGVPQRTVNAGSISGMDLRNVRLYWAFMTDVYGPAVGGCPSSVPDAVGGGYKLDNVLLSYDAARLVPQANTTCARTCGVRAVLTISPPGGTRCAGDPVFLSGELSEATGCPGGALEYRFTGPGGFDTGYTPSATATAAAGAAGSFTLRVRCVADTGCNESVTVSDPSLDDSVAGRVLPDTLRVSRDGDDVVLAWRGTMAPVAYATFRTDTLAGDGAGRLGALADLSMAPPPDAYRNGSPDATTHRDPGAARDGVALHAYRVFGRMPCAGTARDR